MSGRNPQQNNDARGQVDASECKDTRAGLPVGAVRGHTDHERDASATDDVAVSRREVLRGGLRGLAVAAIAAVTGWLGWRSLAGDSPRDGGPDHTCSGDWICTSCRRLDDCVLPQAMSARNAKGNRQ